MQFTFDNESSQNIWTGYLNYENGGMTYLAIFQTFDCMILAHFQEILQELRQEYAAKWWQQKTGKHREGSKYFNTWRHKMFDCSCNLIFPMQSEPSFMSNHSNADFVLMKKFQNSKYVTVFSQLRKSVREPCMPKMQSPEASSRRNFKNPIKWTAR